MKKIYKRICPKCKNTVEHKDYYTYKNGVERNKLCRPCSARKNAPVLFGKDNPMYQKSIKDIWIVKYGKIDGEKRWKEWKINNSKSKKGKVNLGDMNGMKHIEARKKVSDARIEMFKDPENRKIYSDKTKQAWVDGKFDNVNVGQSKWHEYKHSNGTTYKVQGTWELYFIEWLDKKSVKFECHKGRIPYTINGTTRNYYPDFYIHDWNCYVDIKNKYHYSLQEEKFKQLKKEGNNIRLIFGEELYDITNNDKIKYRKNRDWEDMKGRAVI